MSARRSAFERLAGELAGYYRLGVERTPGDLDGKARPLKVEVSRDHTAVRARATFDVRTFEDRNRSARLNAAVTAPSPATGIGLRITSYVAPDRDDPSRLKLVLAGEASRLADGDATFQVGLRDQQGRQVISGEQQLGTATGDRLPFSVNLPVSPGTYTVRFAVMDNAGHVGSVDHRADAYKVPLGPLFGFGPLLVRIPAAQASEPSVALEGVGQNDRLGLQLDLAGAGDSLEGTDVVFEIASTADGPALVESTANVSVNRERGTVLAEGVADVRLLPPGRYVARATVSSRRRHSRTHASRVRDRWSHARGGRGVAAGGGSRRTDGSGKPCSARRWRHAAVRGVAGAGTARARSLSRPRCGAAGCLRPGNPAAPGPGADDRHTRAPRAGCHQAPGARSRRLPERIVAARPTATRRCGKRVPRRAPSIARLLPGDGLPRRVLRRWRKGSRGGRARGKRP